MNKDQVAEVLVEIATLLELKGENPFKTRAYTNAARTIESLAEPLDQLVAEGSLGKIKGIGDALQKKITELVTTGGLKYYDELKASVAPGLVAMLDLSGIGTKKIRALHDQLGIDSVEKLEQACKEGKVQGLSGFGAKTQANILDAIERRRRYASKHLLSKGAVVAERLLAILRQHPDVVRCEIAGSLRRSKEVIGDLDFLASSKKPAQVIQAFTSQPGIQTLLAEGETKASVVVEEGLQADLRVVSDTEFPFALAYFTGSKEHNIVMRQRAIQKGMRLNEYGLFHSETETRDPKLRVACRTEEEIFQALDLAYIPPELREDSGEFTAAEKGEIPRLIDWTDLRGSLHNHSTWSDGHQRPEEIAEFMENLGCSYWAVTDHSKSSFQANGLDASKIRKQIKEIKEINKRLEDEGKPFRLLTGVEVDVLNQGKLDLEDDLLAELDVVVASIHQRLSQTETQTTERLIRAAENRHVHIMGHLSGRLLLEREPYPFNAHAVIDACAETGTWIELNASPYRLDMDWRLWPYAKSKGVKCVINCDAHRADHAAFLRLGAGIARKGWLTKSDVMNTLPLKELTRELGRKRASNR